MRPEIYALSKTQLKTRSSKSCGCTPDIGTPALVLLSALDKEISDQFIPLQQVGSHGFGNADELFHTYFHATAPDIAKIDDIIMTPWDSNKLMEMLFEKIDDAQIFALCANL